MNDENHVTAELIAYCGLVCSECPTFLATKNDDDAARKQTAAMYAEKFGLDFEPADINCDGCKSETGKMISFCQVCEIRKCCRLKNLVNCASCWEQPCEILTTFHEFSPDAKARFEALPK
ncbi:MAG: DUF3795 domain-containing protein [Pseudomonadota bacterium]